jgi:hypothetical protein
MLPVFKTKMAIQVAARALSEFQGFQTTVLCNVHLMKIGLQNLMIKILLLYEHICALICGCTSKRAQVAVKVAKMAVILG